MKIVDLEGSEDQRIDLVLKSTIKAALSSRRVLKHNRYLYSTDKNDIDANGNPKKRMGGSVFDITNGEGNNLIVPKDRLIRIHINLNLSEGGTTPIFIDLPDSELKKFGDETTDFSLEQILKEVRRVFLLKEQLADVDKDYRTQSRGFKPHFIFRDGEFLLKKEDTEKAAGLTISLGELNFDLENHTEPTHNIEEILEYGFRELERDKEQYISVINEDFVPVLRDYLDKKANESPAGNQEGDKKFASLLLLAKRLVNSVGIDILNKQHGNKYGGSVSLLKKYIQKELSNKVLDENQKKLFYTHVIKLVVAFSQIKLNADTSGEERSLSPGEMALGNKINHQNFEKLRKLKEELTEEIFIPFFQKSSEKDFFFETYINTRLSGKPPLTAEKHKWKSLNGKELAYANRLFEQGNIFGGAAVATITKGENGITQKLLCNHSTMDGTDATRFSQQFRDFLHLDTSESTKEVFIGAENNQFRPNKATVKDIDEILSDPYKKKHLEDDNRPIKKTGEYPMVSYIDDQINRYIRLEKQLPLFLKRSLEKVVRQFTETKEGKLQRRDFESIFGSHETIEGKEYYKPENIKSSLIVAMRLENILDRFEKDEFDISRQETITRVIEQFPLSKESQNENRAKEALNDATRILELPHDEELYELFDKVIKSNNKNKKNLGLNSFGVLLQHVNREALLRTSKFVVGDQQYTQKGQHSLKGFHERMLNSTISILVNGDETLTPTNIESLRNTQMGNANNKKESWRKYLEDFPKMMKERIETTVFASAPGEVFQRQSRLFDRLVIISHYLLNLNNSEFLADGKQRTKHAELYNQAFALVDEFIEEIIDTNIAKKPLINNILNNPILDAQLPFEIKESENRLGKVRNLIIKAIEYRNPRKIMKKFSKLVLNLGYLERTSTDREFVKLAQNTLKGHLERTNLSAKDLPRSASEGRSDIQVSTPTDHLDSEDGIHLGELVPAGEFGQTMVSKIGQFASYMMLPDSSQTFVNDFKNQLAVVKEELKKVLREILEEHNKPALAPA